MALQGFSFPLPETRLFQAGGLIYKIKIRGGPSYRGVEVKREDGFNQEMEEIIRSVMGNLDHLQPFSSTHYNVFPYKKPWKVVQTQSHKTINIYPFVLILYLDKSTQMGKPKELKNKLKLQVPSTSQSKHRRSDSPLEEAMLKDLLKDMEAEGRVFVTNPMKTQHKEANLGEDLPHQEAEEEEEEEVKEEEEEEEEETHETPVRAGVLQRLASNIFPFSLFFRD